MGTRQPLWSLRVMGRFRAMLAGALVLAALWGTAPPAKAEAPQPQPAPEGTVQALYDDAAFLDLRNALPPPLLQRFSPCFTPDLVRHFEAHHEDVDRWLAQHDATMKLPMAAGPIFFSNYEGADSFDVGRATIDGGQAQVPVSFTYTQGADTVRWVDIVILRQIDDVWLMDDIRFDPNRWDHYTLRERVALEE